jgi:hypothetical protein
VGPRAGLDNVEKRKILPLPGLKPGQSPVALTTELSRLVCVQEQNVTRQVLEYWFGFPTELSLTSFLTQQRPTPGRGPR